MHGLNGGGERIQVQSKKDQQSLALPSTMPPAAASVAAAAAFLLAGPATGFNIPPQHSSVWPLPATFAQGSTIIFLAPAFSISCGAVCPDPLPDAIARYTSLILFAGAPGLLPTALPALRITVVASAPLALGVDESYNLTVPEDGSSAMLSAATQWGALRGLESFSQLCVWQGPDGPVPAAYAITNAPVVIQDFPRFPARGVLIDTSFNFLTVGAIGESGGRWDAPPEMHASTLRPEATLDSMATIKANFLRAWLPCGVAAPSFRQVVSLADWHITDDPAWSAESQFYPNFTDPRLGGPLNSQAYYSIADQVCDRSDVKGVGWHSWVAMGVEMRRSPLLSTRGPAALWSCLNSTSLATRLRGRPGTLL